MKEGFWASAQFLGSMLLKVNMATPGGEMNSFPPLPKNAKSL